MATNYAVLHQSLVPLDVMGADDVSLKSIIKYKPGQQEKINKYISGVKK